MREKLRYNCKQTCDNAEDAIFHENTPFENALSINCHSAILAPTWTSKNSVKMHFQGESFFVYRPFRLSAARDGKRKERKNIT